MVAAATACLKSLLKLISSMMGMVGMAIILYGLWLLRAWYREFDITSPSYYDFSSATPWFAYTSMGIGAFFCVTTCLGHMAADSVNDYCLSSYMMVMLLLLLLEGAVTADILLNPNWEEDLPEDPSGKFDGFRDFVTSNLEICKWVGLVIISAQGVSVLLCMSLRVIASNQRHRYESEEDYGEAEGRVPLMKHIPQPPQYAVGGGSHIASSKNTTWNAKARGL